MTTERDALDRITALCDRVQPGWQQVVSVEAVRGILAEVTPEAGCVEDRLHAMQVAAEELQRVNDVLRAQPGGILDRDQAWAVLLEEGNFRASDYLLDRLAACVRPAAIDRERHIELLGELIDRARATEGNIHPGWWAARIEREYVRPAAIDRDALVHEFRAVLHEYRTRGYGAENPPVEVALADLVLALVRPVAAKQYPYRDGPHLILGPECFTGDGDEVPQDVIMWRGVAYSNGVTLTPEEAALAREAIRYWVMVRGEQGVTALDRHRALAARLEAAGG